QSFFADTTSTNEALIHQVGSFNKANQIQTGLNDGKIDQWNLHDNNPIQNKFPTKLLYNAWYLVNNYLHDANYSTVYMYPNYDLFGISLEINILGHTIDLSQYSFYAHDAASVYQYLEAIYGLSSGFSSYLNGFSNAYGLYAFQSGQSNEVNQTQNGFKNHATSLQYGNMNDVRQTQDGIANFSIAKQSGAQNKSTLNQTSITLGSTNFQLPTNFAYQDQKSPDTSAVGNEAHITQEGMYNRGVQIQWGESNYADLDQLSSLNTTATQVQLNNDGFSSIVQNGTMNSEAFVFQAEGSFDATTVAGMNLPLYQLPN
ncbi:MAG: hypothetical protein RBU29_08965, partial [bacterium]|nr:hypothetical protein [bacterium]